MVGTRAHVTAHQLTLPLAHKASIVIPVHGQVQGEGEQGHTLALFEAATTLLRAKKKRVWFAVLYYFACRVVGQRACLLACKAGQ